MKISETQRLMMIKLSISDIMDGNKQVDVKRGPGYFSAKKSFTLSLWTMTSL